MPPPAARRRSTAHSGSVSWAIADPLLHHARPDAERHHDRDQPPPAARGERADDPRRRTGARGARRRRTPSEHTATSAGLPVAPADQHERHAAPGPGRPTRNHVTSRRLRGVAGARRAVTPQTTRLMSSARRVAPGDASRPRPRAPSRRPRQWHGPRLGPRGRAGVRPRCRPGPRGRYRGRTPPTPAPDARHPSARGGWSHDHSREPHQALRRLHRRRRHLLRGASRQRRRLPRAQRRRQVDRDADDDRPHPGHLRPRHHPRPDLPRAAQPRPPGRRHARRLGAAPGSHRAARCCASPPSPSASPRPASRRCSASSASPTRRRAAGSATTPSACASGSASPPRCSASRRS